MKPHRVESTPEETIVALPVGRQDVPTITSLRAELRLIRRLVALPMILGILAMGTCVGVGTLMMILGNIFPVIKGRPGENNIYVVVWLLVIAINFAGAFGLPPILPFFFDRRIRGREAIFCDPQLIGELIDVGQAIETAGSNFQKGWFAGCLLALFQRLLPEVNAMEAATLTNKQRDFLMGIALNWQGAQEALVLTVLHSAPVWGDIESLTTILMISRTTESETVREAAQASLSPLQARLQANREDAALVASLGIPLLS